MSSVKKHLIRIGLLFFVTVPLSIHGAAVTPDGSTKTALDKARNNVPVVNIANPNTAGLSHNRYSDFNINQEGLILNNAKQSTVQTQLGGYIFGNPHLTRNASVILNEVTSTRRSALLGFAEVAGQSADLVIANPNGLTLNGAGFINTSRVVLTTGTPIFSAGSLQAFDVRGGDIAIQGNGLNAKNKSDVDIYTQFLQLNAGLYAKKLDLKLGTNTVDYTSGRVIASTSNTSGRLVLLDSSLMGGMYANSIVLVGTDQGLGVNLPPEVLASTGGITITNDGTVSLQKMASKKAVAVKSAYSIAVNGDLYSQTHVSLQANNALDIKALIAARDSLMLNAAMLNNHNEIMAGLNADGSQNKTGSVTITGTVINNQGRIRSSGRTDVNVGTLTNSSGSLIHAGSDLTLLSSSDMINHGEIIATGNLVASAIGRFANHQLLSSGGAMQLTAQTLDNFSTISAGAGLSRINITGTLNNQARISARDTLNIVAQDAVNNGFLNAGLDLSVTSNNLTNNQTLFAGNDMYLYTSNALLNNANIFSLNNLTLSANAANGKTAKIINYKGDIQAYNGNLNLFATDFENRTDVPVIAGTFDAVNIQIIGGKNVSVTNPALGCKATLSCVTTSVDTMMLVSKPPPATVFAGGDMTLDATNITNTYSLISAGGNMGLNAQALNNIPVDIMEVTTIATDSYVNQKYCPRFSIFGVCVGGKKNRKIFQGTQVQKISNVVGSVAATIQAGGSIMGNTVNLNNGNIKGGQAIAAITSMTQETTTATNLTVNLPKGNLGLFIVSKDPASQYLVETNPALTLYENFISSDYILQRLNYLPNQTIKRIGDAFYENKLIRDSILAQTGQRFLQPDLTDDRAQYQYLMDNAVKAQQDLQLVPGIKLTLLQIQQLSQDIAWMEEQNIDGQTVWVPVVYIANAQNIRMNGGRILAGKNINLNVTDLNNAGLMQTGNNLVVNASGHIINKDAAMQSGNTMDMTADGNIENISGQLTGTNVHLTSLSGDIVNQQQTQQIQGGGSGYRSTQTMMGRRGSIEAQGRLSLNAANKISVQGSQLLADAAGFNAKSIEILSTLERADYNSGDSKNYAIDRSETHHESTVQANTIRMHSTGATTIAGSAVNANETLSVTASDLTIVAVNNSHYTEHNASEKGFLRRSSTTEKHSTSTNVGSSMTGGNISLISTSGDITVVGSDIAAQGHLALDSAGNIDVRAGYDGTSDEIQSKKSGWFTGGALYSKTDDQDGTLNKNAVIVNLQGGSVALQAAGDIVGVGVDIQADTELIGSAKNITLRNANDKAISYSRHNKMSIGVGALVKSALMPTVTIEKGQVSVNLAEAEFSRAEKRTTKTTVVGSKLTADNIHLVATASDPDKGMLLIEGASLTANQTLALKASHDVTIEEAKNTVSTQTKEQSGKAQLNFTTKNEYVQVKYAVDEAREAKKNLAMAQQRYDEYRLSLAKKIEQLAQLKQGMADGKVGIEASDVSEMAGLVNNLGRDHSFYKANIALATSELATKVIAVTQQMATAAESTGTYGFNAGLELDINVLEQRFQDAMEQSVGSRLVANNIQIQAGDAATLRGSQLQANQLLSIDSRDLNILAASDHSQSQSRTEDKNMTLSMSIYGNGGDSFSASANQSKSTSQGLQHTNSQLSGGSININTQETTTIQGANIDATETLNLRTRNLNVASVQEQQSSRSRSKGISASAGGSNGLSNVGINTGFSRSRSQKTVLTSLTGNKVNINVSEGTTIKGATIAAVDDQGNDNGQLTLTAGTLNASSLNDTQNRHDLSTNIGVGSIASLDYSNGRNNTKTKTLGTLGAGDIQIANLQASDTRMLNRDIQNNTLDIYNLENQQNLKGSLDTRLLNKEGRQAIKKDMVEFGRNTQKVANGVPKSKGGNALENAVGKVLNKLSDVSFGIVPSELKNGGFLAQVPILLGDRDINAGIFQVRRSDDPYVQNNPNFMPIEDMAFYEKLPPESQAYLNGAVVTKKPVEYTQENALAQSSANGLDNTLEEAIVNGMQQTGADTLNIRYNPSRGGVADLTESFVDKSTPITTGMAKEYGENRRLITQTNQAKGIRSNFTDHSQAAILDNKGAQYIGGGDINLPGTGDSQDRKTAKISATVNTYGAPVPWKEIKKTTVDAGLVFSGSHVNKGDGVASVLAGNKDGNNETATVIERVKGIKDLGHNIVGNKYGDNPSGHSTYECKANCGNNADLTPEQLAAQRRSQP